MTLILDSEPDNLKMYLHIKHELCRPKHFKVNPFKPSGVKWLHFKVFSAILVEATLFNFLTFGHSDAQD